MLRVLVADKNEAVRRVIGEFIKLFPDEFQLVGEIKTLHETWSLSGMLPDVVIADVDCVALESQVVQSFRSGWRPELVLTYTGFDNAAAADAVEPSGVFATLRKPFELEELLEVLRALKARLSA